ncbi:uncharacterized protein LOC110980850 isoform X2 [Acanthaster planci]|nr:uncharacterized protein LOC110980850 isoform X2 [Acanthaster planci]
MKFRSWLTLLLLAESIQLARQSCSSLDPYVDRTPGWSSGDYCAPSVPLNNYENCIDALGMQSREIPDDQLSASSMYNNDPEYGAAYGRVGDARTAGTGWVAGVSDTNQWFKIDIGFLSVVARVTTQTRGWRGETNYVTSYTIEYSIDDVTYTAYEESGSVVTFAANDIPYSVIHNDLSNPVLARYIKILPQTWNAQIAMRAELYGCKHTIASDEQALLDANLVEGWYYDTSGGSATIRYMVDIFSDRIVLESPLGMEDSTIPDGDITASSTETGSDPTNARLNGLSGWTADTADTNQYLIIDLKGNTFISKIQVQGASSSSFTETYYLESSPDGLTYTAYNYESSQKVFTGNSGDGNTGVTEFLPVALFTRFLKINPQTWTGSKPSLRVELYGERIVGDNCDFWYNVGKTTPAFYVVNVTSNPVTYDGVYCGFSNAYTSCLDYKTAGNTVDGYHWIYAAGAGNGFPVYCYFSMIQNDGAYTVISHDTQEEVILSTATLSQPYSSAGSNVHSFTYSNNVDIAEIATVAAASHFCHQSLYYVSSGAKIWASNGQQLVWWESNSDEQMTYWAGADPAGASGCLCGQLGNCLSNKDKCNADSNGKSGESTYDGGFITDKSKLPVKTLKIGGISTSESASYTLGNLVCMDSSTTLPTSCRNAQTAGYTTDGYYLLDPDGSSGSLQPVLVRCDFSTVKNAPTMEVGHNFEGDNEIAEYSQSGGFSKDIAYSDGASVATLTSLVGSATACTQYLGLQCNGFDIYQSSNNWNAWWVAQDGTDMNNWSGTTTAGKCACGVTGSCYSTSEDCNCATSSSTWLEDKGYITDPSALPVSQIRVGRTSSSQRAIITLGKLKCHERVGTQVKTCYDAKQGGATDDGYYLLDADASGSANAFIAECNVTYNSTHASVIFNHDSESRTHVAGAGSAGSFIQSIVYENMDVDQLAAQFTLPSTDYSQTCLQHISYECFDAKLLKSGTSWWVSFSGATKTYWGGASGQDGYCACGLDGTCQDASEKCNCDAEQASWLQDSGYLVDFRDEALPVVQLRFGDTAGGAGSEEGYFTLGKLECFISDREYPYPADGLGLLRDSRGQNISQSITPLRLRKRVSCRAGSAWRHLFCLSFYFADLHWQGHARGETKMVKAVL